MQTKFNNFINIEEVKKLVRDCPVMIDFYNLTENVKDLLFDLHDYIDVMIGYADHYIYRKKISSFYSGSFLGTDFWIEYDKCLKSDLKDEDRTALKKIKNAADYLEKLTKLMFNS